MSVEKSYCGLKQSLRVWFGKFIKIVLEFMLKVTVADRSIFVYSKPSSTIILVVYVNLSLHVITRKVL